MDQTCFSSTSYRCSIIVRTGEFGGQHLHVPETIPKQFLQCGMEHYSAERGYYTGAMKECSWSAIMFRKVTSLSGSLCKKLDIPDLCESVQ